MNLKDAEALDRADPLAGQRAEFALPADVIYLDGNSLGALPRRAIARTRAVVESEWGEGLIRSWNTHDWIDLPRRVGDRLAPLIGAAPGTVVAADSTSVNLFKALSAAVRLRPDRKVILTEEGNFPTDAYIAAGLAGLLGQGHAVRALPAAELAGAMREDVAVVMLTEVNYRTGARLDMRMMTARAHAAGALTLWDLAHSAGAFPVDLAGAGADFAVGCGYKYLNGGPGAPAFVYVAPSLLDSASQPLTGWMGHEAPFAFAPDYRPVPGIDAFRVGTPSVIALSALDAALELFAGVDLGALRMKADALFEVFVGEVAARCPGLELLTPPEADRRGTQASFRHPDAYAIMQALIARGVIGDFRQPDILRFGLTPLYLRFADLYRAAEILGDVIASGAWDRPEYRRRAKVV